MEVILPCDDLYIRSVVTQRPSYDCGRTDRLKYTVEKQIANLLQMEIEYHRAIEIKKYELKGMFDWTDTKAFQSVDSTRKGCMDFNNIMNFCKINGFIATEAEIVAVVRRLDVDADQTINYEEWCQTMQVREPILPPRHNDPSSPVREDDYFRHTSPTKALQTRSPMKG